MLGLADMLSTLLMLKDKNMSKLQKEKVENGSPSWGIYFLTGLIAEVPFIKRRFVAQDESAIIYKIPTGIGLSRPSEIRELFEMVYEDALNELASIDESAEIETIFGVSIGNCLSFKLANYFSPKRLIGVIPGDSLPKCIWESITTKAQAKKYEAKEGLNFESYVEKLSDFSPERNIVNIDASTEIDIYLARFDKMIPYRRGKNLVRVIGDYDKKVNVKISPFGDHVSSILTYKNH